MTSDPAAATPDLPETLPIFPLEGALLLPRGRLPLNIFEPRYLAMTEDALAGPRMIGMIQPRERERIEPTDHPDVYGTGCAGRITAFNETDDGRNLLTLTGVCRFDVSEELPLKRGYRQVVPAYDRYLSDLSDPAESGVDRSALLDVLKAYLERRNFSADWDTIDGTGTDDLIAALSMMCPFAPSEKQALLETADQSDRGALMISLLQMDSLSGSGPPAAGAAMPH